MREYLRLAAKTGVALFCVWHMLSVGLYAIPNRSTHAAMRWIDDHVMTYVSPYMLITSQWQQWNLFAPDPLRRIVFYRVETQNVAGDWAYVTSINDHTYGPWRHAVRFKLLGQVFEENTNRPELSEHGAQVLCDELRLDPSSGIRIWHDLAIVPYVTPSPSEAWWNAWIPHFESTLALETVCHP